MKVLVAGDLHFHKEKFDSLRRLSIDCDILCLTGDYLDDSLGNRDGQIDWVSKWVVGISIPVVMCSGNHDLDEFAECDWINNLANRAVIVDNSVWTYRGITFGAVPYIGAELRGFARCDILVCHLPPSHTKTSMQDGNDFGDDDLYFSIAGGIIKPKYIVCGHVGNPFKMKDVLGTTQIINASNRFFVIDLCS